MKQMEEIYAQFHKQIYSYLYHLTSNPDLAGELTQETFYQVLISIPKFKGRSKLSTWIYSIARNTFLKKIKKESRFLPTEEKALMSLLPQALDSDPSDILEQKEGLKQIKAIIARLPEKYATVLILRDQHGLAYKEICLITGMSEASVKVTLFRARQKFKEIYSSVQGGE